MSFYLSSLQENILFHQTKSVTYFAAPLYTLLPTGLQEEYLSIPFLLQLFCILKWELERSHTCHKMEYCPFSISEIWSDMYSMVDPKNSLSYSQHGASAEKWMNGGSDVVSPVYWLMADMCDGWYLSEPWRFGGRECPGTENDCAHPGFLGRSDQSMLANM